MKVLFGILLSFLSLIVNSQSPGISGRVTDSNTRKSLAFVNIVYNSHGNGTVSSIDGEFNIPESTKIEFLKFSYLGYHSKIISREEALGNSKLVIRMEKTTYNIEEVSVTPGINPAHRIIQEVIANRDLNNPEKMRSFSYNSYSKMFFTLSFDTLAKEIDEDPAKSFISIEYNKDTAAVSESDSSLQEALDFFEKQHLFLMEFVSTREFLYPDRNKETVTASRVSGFKDPSFTLLATQLQSFSFYEELITIMDRKYLNPISRGSTRKYLFILEDTMYTELNDTLFVISFRPLKGRNFDGLKGFLHINTNKYAVQNVVAEAAETNGLFRIKIQQKYDLVENKQWFPVQLNTDIIFQPEEMKANGIPIALLGIGKSYLSEIVLEPELKRRDFSHIELQIEDDAHKQDDRYWDLHRAVPLSSKDTNTYEFIDSVGEEANIDRTLTVIETLVSGYIPWKFLNIDYRSIFHYDHYEGFRFGLSAETNQKLSPWFSLGAKVGYGLKDKGFKYGGNLQLNLYPPGETYLRLSYDKDVYESAGIDFIEEPPMTSSEIFRTFLIRNKDIVEQKELAFGTSLLPYVKVQLFLNQQSRQVTSDYFRFPDYSDIGFEPPTRLFHFTETGIKFRYAFKEKFMETPRGNRLSLGTDYPVIQANISRGLNFLDGQFEYTRIEARISKTFLSKNFGQSIISITGGYIDSNLPYPRLYNGHGSYGKFTVETGNSFATMRMNEFVSDRFVSLFFKQNFGELLFKTDKFKPKIALVQNIGFGDLVYKENHYGISMRTMDEGYYESGLLINNILNQMFVGYGLGVFYRYGPYQLTETIDNFAFKFTITINLN